MFRYKEDDIQQASKLAAESLGYSSLRPQQEKIVSTFVQGNDAIMWCHQARLQPDIARLNTSQWTFRSA